MSQKKTLLFACASALSFLGWSGSGLAADAPAAATAGQIEEVVVTARRVEENAQSVPVAVTALSGQDLREQGVKNVRDLLGTAPALFITTGTGGVTTANLSIRGQSPSNTLLINAVTVGVYFNGVSYPRAVGLRSALYDIADVQVLKGPQGTLFGKNTTGGAVLINTKQPSLTDLGGFGQLTAGNYDTRQFTGAVTVPLIDDKLAVRLAVLNTHRSGYGRSGAGIGADHQTGNLNELGARFSVLYKPAENVRLALSADTLRVRGGNVVMKVTGFIRNGAGGTLGPTSLAMLTGVATEMGLANPSSPASQQAALANLQNIWRTGDAYHNQATGTFGHFDQGGGSADLSIDFGGLTFRSISGVRQNNRDDSQDFDGTPFRILQPRSVQESKNFTQEFQLLNDPTAKLAWIVGAFYNKEDGTEGSRTLQLSGPNFNVQDYDVHNRSYAAFAQVNYTVTDTVRVTAGARYTKESERILNRARAERQDFSFLACTIAPALNTVPPCGATGRTSAKKPTFLLSADWTPVEDVLVYGKFSTSFQAGGVNIGATSNAVFKPEQAKVYELGAKGDYFDHRLRLNVAAYYTDYTNIQRTAVVAINNALVTVVANAAKARIKGAEFEMTARPIAPLTLTASGSVVDVKYKTFIDSGTGRDRSKEAFPTPKYQFAAGVAYRIDSPLGDLALRTGYRYQSNVNLQGTSLSAKHTSQSAYGLWDARATLSLPAQSSIALYVKNITNKTYITSASPLDSSFGFDVGYLGDPRTFGVEFRKEFGGG